MELALVWRQLLSPDRPGADRLGAHQFSAADASFGAFSMSPLQTLQRRPASVNDRQTPERFR